MKSNALPIAAGPKFTWRRGRVRETRAASGFPVLEGADARLDPNASIASEPTLLLHIDEVARQLGLGRTIAYQLIARREIPFVRIGRCVRVPRRELEAWISTRTVEPIEVGSERER